MAHHGHCQQADVPYYASTVSLASFTKSLGQARRVRPQADGRGGFPGLGPVPAQGVCCECPWDGSLETRQVHDLRATPSHGPAWWVEVGFPHWCSGDRTLPDLKGGAWPPVAIGAGKRPAKSEMSRPWGSFPN